MKQADWKTCEDPGSALEAHLDSIKLRCAARTTLDRYFLGLYGGLTYQGYTSSSAEPVEPEIDDSAAVENVIRQVADTVLSKVLRDDIAPRVITRRGDWMQQKRAKNLDQWLDGQSRKHDVNGYVVPAAALHSVVIGSGFAYVWHDGEDLVVEVQPPWELHTDPAETIRGKTRTIYRERIVARAALEALYPDADIPTGTGASSDQVLEPYEVGDDYVRTVEGWTLGSGDKPGRYVLSVQGVTLADTEWTCKRLPFARLLYRRRPVGYWGQGLVEDLAGAQVTLAAAQVTRLDAIAKLSAPFILIQQGSNVVSSHMLSDLNAREVRYTGVKPEIVVPNAISPGLTEVVGSMRAQMYALAGVSEGSATMQKPTGLDSGKALRTYHDLESERLSQYSRAIERFVVDLYEGMVAAARDLALTTDVPDVVAVAKGSAATLRWADVGLEEDEYVLTIVPASSLATTLSGRIQDVEDMLRSGMVTDPIEGRALLKLPDVEQSNAMASSMYDLLVQIVEERILDEGEAYTPEPTWDLALAQRIATSRLAWAKLNGYPEDKVNLLQAFLSEVVALLAANQPAPAAPGPAVGGQPVPGAESINGGAITGGGVVPLGA